MGKSASQEKVSPRRPTMVGGHQPAAGGGRRKAAGQVANTAQPTFPDGFHLRIELSYFDGHGLYEYDGEHARSALTYENDPMRNYYRVGDIILVQEREYRFAQFDKSLAEIFKDSSWWPAIAKALGTTISSGWKITEIDANGDGTGEVWCQRVVIFEEGAVEMEWLEHWGVGYKGARENFLRGMWPSHTYGQSLKEVASYITDGAVMILTGGTSAAAKQAVKSSAKLYLKKHLKRKFAKFLLKRWAASAAVKHIVPATKAFAEGVAKELIRTKIENQARQAVGTTVISEKDITDIVLQKGATSFVDSLLDAGGGGLGKFMTEHIPGWSTKDDDIPSLKRWLREKLVLELAKYPSRYAKTLVDEFNSAFAKSAKGGETPKADKLFSDAAIKNLTTPLEEAAKSFMPNDVAKEMEGKWL